MKPGPGQPSLQGPTSVDLYRRLVAHAPDHRHCVCVSRSCKISSEPPSVMLLGAQSRQSYPLWHSDVTGGGSPVVPVSDPSLTDTSAAARRSS